ncbi:MAG: helix-turn-helix transcriptional regulator [Euryarchaeota archaeon]|nr:helix-turn-helix transcriptional regulator [Euryarchaeota archaeon]
MVEPSALPPARIPLSREHPLLRVVVMKMLQERPRTGYDLLKEFARRTDEEWIPSKGTIYPLLARMEGEGFVRSSPGGARSRRVYRTTAKANQLLAATPLAGGNFIKRNQKVMRVFFSLLQSEEERRIMEQAFRIAELSYDLVGRHRREVMQNLEACIRTLESLQVKRPERSGPAAEEVKA